MEKRVDSSTALNGTERSEEFRGLDRYGVKDELGNPIRKQSPEDRRKYMREYMREYRLRHPGLSTPYVRKYRTRGRIEPT